MPLPLVTLCHDLTLPCDALTLQDAVDLVEAGGVIAVAEGSYEVGDVELSADVTIRAAAGAVVALHSATGPVINVVDHSGATVIVEDL